MTATTDLRGVLNLIVSSWIEAGSCLILGIGGGPDAGSLAVHPVRRRSGRGVTAFGVVQQPHLLSPSMPWQQIAL
jgi:hypothetical protein